MKFSTPPPNTAFAITSGAAWPAIRSRPIGSGPHTCTGRWPGGHFLECPPVGDRREQGRPRRNRDPWRRAHRGGGGRRTAATLALQIKGTNPTVAEIAGTWPPAPQRCARNHQHETKAEALHGTVLADRSFDNGYALPGEQRPEWLRAVGTELNTTCVPRAFPGNLKAAGVPLGHLEPARTPTIAEVRGRLPWNGRRLEHSALRYHAGRCVGLPTSSRSDDRETSGGT